ncbi:MAG: PilZ domain-containing protein, partial [Vicinamibacterales bacterium]
MSPREFALLDLPGTADHQRSYRVELATEQQLDEEKTRHDRRAHTRHRDRELQWIRQARLGAGHSVAIVDLSVGGALVDTPVPLRPDSILTLDIEGRGFDKTIQFRVVRCQVGALKRGETIYRGACEFTTPIDLPVENPVDPRVLYPGRFGRELTAKRVVARIPAVAVKSLAFDDARTAEPQDATLASAWQKIVVRYVEKQILKGYTQDFNP